MRPDKLIMSAFGPYAGKVEVNLNKLGDKGLYLITGDTGAGKTTIFDAITYALFGKGSGENRESTMFRSKYAEPETPTEVQLYFTCNGKNYHIKRNPEYSRPKSRGEGLTVEKANAELTCPDGRIINKQKEVDNAIVEIIGVDRNQFTQIAMIAQGDFLKLLLASTDERKKIFQKLFKTRNYYVLQERLKEESGKLGREYDMIKNSIADNINGIICDEDDVLFVQVKKAKENEMPFSEIFGLLEQIIKNDEDTELKFEKEIKELDKEIEEITKVLTRAKTLKTAKDSLEKSEAELVITTELKKELLENLKSQEKKQDETNQIIKRIAEIDAELPEYDELENIKNELTGISEELKSDEKQLADDTKELQKSEQVTEQLENELKVLQNVGADKAKVEAEIKELKSEKAALENLDKENGELSELECELKRAQDLYKEKVKIAEEKRKEFDSLNRAYLDEQAGILAEFLEEGKACPVCGSLSHPAPAVKSISAPSKDELEQAKNASETAQKAQQEESVNAGKLKGAVTEKKAAIDKISKELLGNLSLDTKKKEISEELLKVEQKLSEIEKDEKKKIEIEMLLPKKKEEIEVIKKEISLIEERITKNNVIEENLKKRIADLNKKLMYKEKAVALEEKQKLESGKTEMEEALKNAKEAFDTNEKNIVAITSRIEENKKLLVDCEEIDIESEEEKQEEVKTKRQELLRGQKSIHSRKMSNVLSLESIRQKSDEIKEVEENWMWVKALSNTANGNISGKEKIMLETYIQMTYFDRIIERANTRFKIMSGGQYELKRRREAENNRSQSGLEINVIDHYNGTERSVKTLSGGESFKASLSLALGLSDEIQSSAGGIRLDTMFVDEGFGSLDEESLAQAIKALSNLAEGNRLVGIISHVSELKERIDKQIVVTKEKTGGSKIEIRV